MFFFWSWQEYNFWFAASPIFYWYEFSGSEDKKIYIYDLFSGKVIRTLDDHPSVVHLVHCSDADPLSLVSSSVQNVILMLIRFLLVQSNIFSWSPKPFEGDQKKIISEEVSNFKTCHLTPQPMFEENLFVSTHRMAVESLMKK